MEKLTMTIGNKSLNQIPEMQQKIQQMEEKIQQLEERIKHLEAEIRQDKCQENNQ